MPTRYIILPLTQPIIPDGTGSGNTPAQVSLNVSATAQTANTPKLTFIEWLFDADADEHLQWAFPIPGDYSSGGSLQFSWRSDSTVTGVVVWKTAQFVQIPGVTVGNTGVYTAASTVTSTVASTISTSQTVSTSLTTTNMASGRRLNVMLGRDADNAGDTMTGDATLETLIFTYEAL